MKESERLKRVVSWPKSTVLSFFFSPSLPLPFTSLFLPPFFVSFLIGSLTLHDVRRRERERRRRRGGNNITITFPLSPSCPEQVFSLGSRTSLWALHRGEKERKKMQVEWRKKEKNTGEGSLEAQILHTRLVFYLLPASAAKLQNVFSGLSFFFSLSLFLQTFLSYFLPDFEGYKSWWYLKKVRKEAKEKEQMRKPERNNDSQG